MTNDRSQLRVGMAVVGSDEASLGAVKEVRDTDFLVDRELQRDIYVPFEAVRAVDDLTIVLNIPASQADSMNWPSPPVAG